MTGLEILFILFIIAALYEACCMLINYIYDCMVYVFGGATTAELAMEKQRRIELRLADLERQDAEREMRQAQLRLAEEQRPAEEQRRGKPSLTEVVGRAQLALFMSKMNKERETELQGVRALKLVQTHPRVVEQMMTKQTVAKPLVGPFPEQDSGETTLNRLIKAGIAVPAHGRG